MGAAAEEETKGKIVAEGFVAGRTEVCIEFGADNVAGSEGVAPLSTEVRGEDMGVVAPPVSREGGEEGRAVERTEVPGPERRGEEAELTKKVGAESEGGSETVVERPPMTPLLPAGKRQRLGGQTIKEPATGIPSEAQAEGGIIEGLHIHVGRVDLTTVMLNKNIDGKVEGERSIWRIKGDAVGQAHVKGLLMSVPTEDEALPVDPGVEVIAWQIDENLKTHLGVL